MSKEMEEENDEVEDRTEKWKGSLHSQVERKRWTSVGHEDYARNKPQKTKRDVSRRTGESP